MTMETVDTDLFTVAQQCFQDFLQEFEAYGIHANPGMELRPGSGVLCYYDLKDGNVYLSVPNPSDPAGKLHLLFLRSILRCDTNAELLQFLRLFVPHVIAHELAHHFRHRYGLFSANLWHEEQVANQLAMAVTKHRLTPEEREFTRKILPRAMEGLAEKLDTKNVAADSYHNILYALNVSGQIDDEQVENIEIVQKLFAVKPEDILKNSGQLSEDLLQRLDQRDEVIDAINEQYASDYMRYIYYHVGWLYLALTSRETQYVEEFVRLHLNRRVDLLPLVSRDSNINPDEKAIQACFRAHHDLHSISEAGSRYFYKRYRSLLLSKLQSTELLMPSQTEQVKKEAGLLLENWSEHESDTLTYLSQMAPPALRNLFPHLIEEHLDPKIAMQIHLPTETDIRLWKHAFLQEKDEGAANTLYRLTLLDQTDIYRSLPAEVMLELAHNLCRIKLRPGETIIWEGGLNDDVYILIEGKLEVFVTQNQGLKQVGSIKLGEVFGEMAFFTREPRTATVRAAEPTECFVLKDSDLRLFSFKHPSILVQMAGVLAKRLANFMKAQDATRAAASTATSVSVEKEAEKA
jgi:CRP/FNR family transcriptional regulator, cyclic AMP receptor protein